MKITITLSANAGVAIHCGGHRIWVDALHDQKELGFSTVEEPLQRQMLKCPAFSAPDFICYTHCHGDHFSGKLTRAAKVLWPNAKLMLPERFFEDQILVSGENYSYTEGDLTLRFMRLTHEGAAYADCIHYGMLITVGDRNILIPGDCQTASPELAKAVSGMRIDLALLNFPWLTLKRGHDFVKGIMKPSRIIAYHLPFERDDCNGYRRAAERAVQKLPEPDARLLSEPLQKVELDI